MLVPAIVVSVSLIFALLLVNSPQGESTGVFRPPSAGWSTTYFSLTRAMMLNNSAQLTESLTYQASTGRVIVSNMLASSNTTGFTLSTAINGQIVTASLSGNSLYPVGESTSTFGTFGLFADPVSDNIVWAGVGLFFPTATSACAAEGIDTTTRKTVAFYDFSPYKNTATNCVVDDVYVSSSSGVSDYLYATDFFGYRIYKVDLSTDAVSVLSSSQALLCTGYGTANGCLGVTMNGPNGITMYVDKKGAQWLLISLSPNGLVKMNPSTGAGTAVTPGPSTSATALQYLDGMSMYMPSSTSAYLNSVLYAASGTDPTGALLVMTSTDQWSTFELRQVLNMNCNDPSATAIRPAGSSYLLGLCNNNFVPGVSLVNIVPGFTGLQPIAMTAEFFTYNNLVPESFGYDPNRNMLVFGSQSSGGLRGFPYNNLDGDVINYQQSASHTYVAPGTSGMTATAGVQVNPNNAFGSSCYALTCQGSFGNPTTSSLYLVDLCHNVIVSYVSLPRTTTTIGSMANDVTALNGKAYVTDFQGNQVWSVDINGLTLSNPKVVLTSANCATNDPSFCVIAPNGIVPINVGDGFLIMSIYHSGVAKYVPSTGAFTKVLDPTGLLGGFDGLTISSDGNVVYGVRSSSTQVYNSIYAFTSCNYWQNSTLLATFQTACNISNPTANQLITNTDGTQDLVILCNDGFGPGPYWIQRVRNVNNIVANEPLSIDSCMVMPDSGDDDSSSNSYNSGNVVGGAIGFLILFVCIYAFLAFLVNREAFLGLFRSGSAASSTGNSQGNGNDKSADRQESTASVTEMSRLPTSASKH